MPKIKKPCAQNDEPIESKTSSEVTKISFVAMGFEISGLEIKKENLPYLACGNSGYI